MGIVIYPITVVHKMGKYSGVITVTHEVLEFCGSSGYMEYETIRKWSELKVELPKCVSLRRRQQIIYPNFTKGFVVIDKPLYDNRYLLKLK